jgi:GNAT superfamily N-acetyltransferase
VTVDIRVARPNELADLVSIDDDAATLYAEAGLAMTLADDHPFVQDEQARWRAALARDAVFVASREGSTVGFAAMAPLDGANYLDQLSVRRSAMRTGVGSRLLAYAIERSAPVPLWLTTYGHLPFNGPWYERVGFQRVPEERCGEGVRGHLRAERAALPAPEQRVAMVLRFP